MVSSFFSHHAARFGIPATAHYAAWKLADRLAGYAPYRGFVRSIAEPFPLREQQPADFSWRTVPADELARYCDDPAYDLSAQFLDTAVRDQYVCVGVFSGEKLVGYGFSSAKPVYIDAQFRFEFPPGWIYNFKAFTLPAWRGKQVHARLWAGRQEIFRERGCERFAGIVMATNYPSLASFRRLGFSEAFAFSIVGKQSRRRLVAGPQGRGTRAAISFALPGGEARVVRGAA